MGKINVEDDRAAHFASRNCQNCVIEFKQSILIPIMTPTLRKNETNLKLILL